MTRREVPSKKSETQVFAIRRRDRNHPLTLAAALDRASDPRAALLVNAQSGRAAVHRPAAADLAAIAEEHCRVYRLQTDDGERVIGRLVSPAWVAQAAASDAPIPAPADAWNALVGGKTVFAAPGRARAAPCQGHGRIRVELSGFTDGMVDRLKATGLISEIITWKLRLFVPTGAAGPTILGALMDHFPLLCIADRAAA